MTGTDLTMTTIACVETSLREWALRWVPAEPVPMSLTSRLPGALAAARSQLAPASYAEFAGQVLRVFTFAKAIGVVVPNVSEATQVYTETLRDIPLDLLTLAVDRIRKGYTYGMRLPLPGEIRSQVSEELAARKLLVSRLNLAIESSDRATMPGAEKRRRAGMYLVTDAEPLVERASEAVRAEVMAEVRAFAAEKRVDLGPPEPRERPEDAGRKAALAALGAHRERLQAIRAECLGETEGAAS